MLFEFSEEEVDWLLKAVEYEQIHVSDVLDEYAGTGNTSLYESAYNQVIIGDGIYTRLCMCEEAEPRLPRVVVTVVRSDAYRFGYDAPLVFYSYDEATAYVEARKIADSYDGSNNRYSIEVTPLIWKERDDRLAAKAREKMDALKEETNANI